MSLSYIGQQITIYVGLFLAVTGIIGNGINVLVFSMNRSYRTTPCTFYFLIASAYNIIYISMSLLSRIVAIGFGIDLTQTSTSWCKIRPITSASFIVASLSCTCLATIDQFFASSQSANIRRFSNIKLAHLLVSITTIVWLLHGIPSLVLYNISPTTHTCINNNDAYIVYFSIYNIAFISVIPVLVMVVFGYLTYRNIRLTRVLAQQQADRQLVRMISVQIALVLISHTPTGINTIYSKITSSVKKDTNRVIDENFASTIFSVMGYIYLAVSSLISLKIIKCVGFREVVICF
jgi:hypothetical protein